MIAAHLLPILLLGLPAPADVLTAAEAVRRAPRMAPAAERADREVLEARAHVDGARSAFGPRVLLSAGAVTTNDPVDAFGLSLKQERFDAAGFFASDPNSPAFMRDVSGSLSVELPIDVSGEARHRLRAARLGAAAAEAGGERLRQGIALEALTAFVRARQAEDAAAIARERAEDATKDEGLARLLLEQGLVTPADPARASAARAEARAEVTTWLAERDAARAALARLLGEEGRTRELGPMPDPPPEPATDVALELRPVRKDVEAARLASDAAQAAARQKEASRLPQLALTGRYEVHTHALAGRWGDAASAAVGLRVPLFTSGRLSSEIAAARARSGALDAGARDQEARSREEAEASRARRHAAAERRKAYEEAENAAQTAVGVLSARYEAGVARLTDLIDARTASSRARLGALAARADEVLASAALRFALGAHPLTEAEDPIDTASSSIEETNP